MKYKKRQARCADLEDAVELEMDCREVPLDEYLECLKKVCMELIDSGVSKIGNDTITIEDLRHYFLTSHHLKEIDLAPQIKAEQRVKSVSFMGANSNFGLKDKPNSSEQIKKWLGFIDAKVVVVQ